MPLTVVMSLCLHFPNIIKRIDVLTTLNSNALKVFYQVKVIYLGESHIKVIIDVISNTHDGILY